MLNWNYLGRLAFHGTKLVGRVVAILGGVALASVWEGIKAGPPAQEFVDDGSSPNDAIPTRDYPAMHSGGYRAVGDEWGPY